MYEVISQKCVTNRIESYKVSIDWMSRGRPPMPRLLFLSMLRRTVVCQVYFWWLTICIVTTLCNTELYWNTLFHVCSRKYSDYIFYLRLVNMFFEHVSFFLFFMIICNQDAYRRGLFSVTYQVNQYLEKRYLVCLVPFKRLPVKSIDSQKERENISSQPHQNKILGNIHQARTLGVEHWLLL